TPEEILAGLDGSILKKELHDRAIRRGDLNWLLFANKKGVATIVENKEDVELLKQVMIPRADMDTTEIKGVTAYPGKIQGVARIVMNRDEFQKMHTGDILISTMTTPDFVILMQQASAIVTDIGGLLCHAAIVSREIHKPCIIGTKISTQVIKDGDLIEVDADNGVVRILKRVSIANQDNKISELVDAGIYNKSLWTEMGYWLQPVFSSVLFSHWHRTDVVKKITPELDFHIAFNMNGHFFQFDKDAKNIYEYIKTRYSKKSLKDVSEALDEEGKKIFTLLNHEISHSDSYIENNIEKIIGICKELYGFWMVGSYISDALTPLAIDTKYVATEAEFFAHVHPHLRDTWIETEAKTVIDIAKKFIKKYPKTPIDLSRKLIENDFELLNEIKEYIKSYSWCRISKWIGEQVDFEYAYKRVEDEIKNCIDGNHIETKRIKTDESKLDGLVSLSISTAYWRAECGKMEMIFAIRMRKILQHIAVENNINYRQALLLSPSELIRTIKNSSKLIENIEKILFRESGFFSLVLGKDKEFVLNKIDTGYDLLNDLYTPKADTNSKVDILKGIGASPGHVEGKVRIIHSAKDFSSFKQGEILVAPETSPTFVPLMRMASAILTGRGGITSHAAIVSRELGKPCIIAIKDVVRILKDGDLIEVDAEKGIVKILSRVEGGKVLVNLADRYLELVGERKLYPPLNNYSAFIQGSEYNIQKYYKKWYEDKVRIDLFVHMKDSFSQVWLIEDDMKFASEFAMREYLKDKVVFGKREEYILESRKKIDKIYSEYTYNKIAETKYEDLFRLISEIRDIIWDVNAAVIFSVYFDKELCLGVLKAENYPITDEKFDSLWEKAIEPKFESFDKEQFEHVLNLIKDEINWGKIVEQCQYTTTDYYSAKTLGETDKALKINNKVYINNVDKAKEVLAEEDTKRTQILKSYNKWIRGLSENEATVAEYIQAVMRIRDARKNFFAKGLTIIYRIAERMFNEVGIDRDLIPFYTVHELLKGIEYLKSSVANLTDRKKGFQWLVPYASDVQALNVDVDSGVEKVNKYFKDSHLSKGDRNMIHGQSGFKGNIKGKVRIVLNVNSDHGFIDGEVLVTGMTRPEYVPLMKKASAIITDEGGITCHAAIVSRELKIPCVIGTKIATRILKDGDLVEVDANKGTVRIIK
ncbi:MAG: PEP-utilizing enzyme, partial [Candidatus Paceibacterota bacterium]